MGLPSSLVVSFQRLWCAAIAEVTRFAELPADAPGAGGLEGDHLAVGLAERCRERDRRSVLRRGVPADGEEVRQRLHRRCEEVRKQTRVSTRKLPNLSRQSGPCITSSLRISGATAMLFMVMSITPRAQEQEGTN